MLRSMTGFGRCVMEDADWTQTWEIRSVNNRHLDLKWRLPLQARGLESRLLSRSVEDSATVCSVLVPWNSCGMTQATVLGVSTFVYMPYCIFHIVSPLMSLCVAALGWKIKKAASSAGRRQ